MSKIIVLLLLFWVAPVAAGSDNPSIPDMDDKNGYVEPFQMFDNVYYVGDKWVSAYAINTSEGLVLIDTLDFPYSKWIPKNLKKLGLNPETLKYIIVTHGHSDHVGGAEYLQSLYDSKVLLTSADYLLAVAQAHQSKGERKFSAPSVDEYAEEGDTLTIGDTTFKFYITPGHTKGCLSIDFIVKDKGKPYRAFVVGGNGTNFEGLDLANKYLDSVHRIRKLAQSEPKVSVNLANHPRMNQIFENRLKLSSDDGGNPFIDQSGFFTFLDILEKRAIEKLKEEALISSKRSAIKSKSPSAGAPID